MDATVLQIIMKFLVTHKNTWMQYGQMNPPIYVLYKHTVDQYNDIDYLQFYDSFSSYRQSASAVLKHQPIFAFPALVSRFLEF